MQNVTQGWLMHRLSGRAFDLGLLGFAQFGPILVLTLGAGVVIDRVDKRKLILATQALAFVQAVILALAVQGGWITPGHLLAIVALLGMITAFDLPARQTLLVDLVDREHLGNAIALNSAGFNAARFIGPALAGVVVASWGEAASFWLNAATFLPILVFFARLDLHAPAVAEGGGGLVAGLRYIRCRPQMRSILLLVAASVAFGFQYQVLLPIYARDLLGTGPRGYGALAAAAGAGAVIGALASTSVRGIPERLAQLGVGLLIGALGLAGFAASRWFVVSLACGLVVGFGMITFLANAATLLQTSVDDAYRGRVMSAYTLAFLGMAPVGALLTGLTAEWLGARTTTGLSATVLAIAAVVSLRLRQRDVDA